MNGNHLENVTSHVEEDTKDNIDTAITHGLPMVVGSALDRM